MGVLKIGALDVGSKSFTPQGEAGSWECPQDRIRCTRGEVYGGSVSQPFLPNSMLVYVIHLMCRVSGFLSEVISLHVAILSACPWEEGSSGASYVIILVDLLLILLF